MKITILHIKFDVFCSKVYKGFPDELVANLREILLVAILRLLLKHSKKTCIFLIKASLTLRRGVNIYFFEKLANFFVKPYWLKQKNCVTLSRFSGDLKVRSKFGLKGIDYP